MVTRWLACVTVVLVMVGQPCSLLATSIEQPRPATPIADSISKYAAGLAERSGQVPLAPAVSPHRGRAPRLQPILIGAGIGAALFGFMTYRYSFSDSGSRGGNAIKGALVGAGAGGVIGYAISAR